MNQWRSSPSGGLISEHAGERYVDCSDVFQPSVWLLFELLWLELSCHGPLESIINYPLVGIHFFPTGISFQFFYSLEFGGFESSIFALPLRISRLADSMLTAGIRNFLAWINPF